MTKSPPPPCIKLPEIPKFPPLVLPLGGELQGFADFSLGPPSGCSITFSLMAQITPLLASITCVIKILGVIAALKEFAGNPLTKGPELIQAIEKAAGCIAAVLPPYLNILISIKGILQLIINFLSCITHELDSLLKIRASVDFSAAEGNPVLQKSLACFEANLQTSMKNQTESMGSIQPLLDLVGTLGEIAGIPLSLSFEMSAGLGASETINKLKETIDSLNQAINIVDEVVVKIVI